MAARAKSKQSLPSRPKDRPRPLSKFRSTAEQGDQREGNHLTQVINEHAEARHIPPKTLHREPEGPHGAPNLAPGKQRPRETHIPGIAHLSQRQAELTGHHQAGPNLSGPPHT
eukprot:3601908-Pyramimonas_sp.AAC.1